MPSRTAADLAAGVELPWSTPFKQPIPLGKGGRLDTLHDARSLILGLPEAESGSERWQTAVENLLQAAEHGGAWLDFARIAMMQALYPKPRQVKGPSNKGPEAD